MSLLLHCAYASMIAVHSPRNANDGRKFPAQRGRDGTENAWMCWLGMQAMKHELKQLRRAIVARIRTGEVPDWSWPRHIQLIEAIDAVLHDLSLMPHQARQTSRLGDRVHLLEAASRASGGLEQRRISASIERLKAHHH